MIGLDLSGCVHKKQVKWGIIRTLPPLVFGTYSYILHFVIASEFYKIFNSYPKCWISYSSKSHGNWSSEAIKFCTRKMIKKTLRVSMENDYG